MRTLAIPFAIWLGVLQLSPASQPPNSLQATGTLLAAAAALAGLTVSVYRLGVWRQEMSNTKDNIGAEIARYREDSKRQFEQILHQLGRMDARLTRLEQERAA